MQTSKTVMLSFTMILIASLFTGAGSFAYFSDIVTSTGNTFTAGTFADLKVSDNDETWADGVTATWTATNMEPGQEFPFNVEFVGLAYDPATLSPSSLEITCNYDIDENDCLEPETNCDNSPDDIAKQMMITRFLYNGVDHLPDICDDDGDGKKTFYDLKQCPVTGLPVPPTPPDGQTNFRLSVKFSEDAGNDFQGDTFVLTMIFTLK